MMNEFQQKLLEYADKIGEVGARELPIVFQEMVTYTYYHSILCGVVWFVVMVAMIYVATVLMRNNDSNEDNRAFGQFMGVVLLIIAPLLFGVLTLFYINTLVKTIVAPRVVVLEKLQDLYKEKQ